MAKSVAGRDYEFFAQRVGLKDLPATLRDLASFAEAAPSNAIWRVLPAVDSEKAYESGALNPSSRARWVFSVRARWVVLSEPSDGES